MRILCIHQTRACGALTKQLLATYSTTPEATLLLPVLTFFVSRCRLSKSDSLEEMDDEHVADSGTRPSPPDSPATVLARAGTETELDRTVADDNLSEPVVLFILASKKFTRSAGRQDGGRLLQSQSHFSEVTDEEDPR